MDWLSLLISFLSLGVAVFIATNQTRINIDKIIERDYVGQLTKAQALALINIYLSTIKKDLRYHVDHFLQHEFPKFHAIKTPESMQNFVYGKYKQCISEVRDQFNSFKLKGGVDFVFVIEEVSQHKTASSLQKIIDILSSAHSDPTPDTELIKSRMLSVIRSANEDGEKDLKKYIRGMY